MRPAVSLAYQGEWIEKGKVMADKRKIGLLLLTAALLFTGCGGEAVHTGAQVKDVGETAVIAENESADTNEEEVAEAADSESEETEKAAEAPDTEGVGAEKSAAGRDGGFAESMEMDETLRIELTEELLIENEMDTSVVEDAPVTKGCSFTPPEAFMESEEVEGMYVTKRYPIDASAIYYTALEGDAALQLMTEETFKAQTEANFEEVYGEKIEVAIESFERIRIDGCPAFRILCRYQVNGTELTQLEYTINADKSYVITYLQTAEYDRMEEYEASAETIRLRF